MNRDTSKIYDYPYQIHGMLADKKFETETEFFNWFNESADTCVERTTALFDAIIETALYELHGYDDLAFETRYDTFLEDLEDASVLDYYTFDEKVPHFEIACEEMIYMLADEHVEQFNYTWFMDDLFDMSNAGPGACECLLNSIVDSVENEMEMELNRYENGEYEDESYLPFENVKDVKNRIKLKNARNNVADTATLVEEPTKMKM